MEINDISQVLRPKREGTLTIKTIVTLRYFKNICGGRAKYVTEATPGRYSAGRSEIKCTNKWFQFIFHAQCDNYLK